MGSAGHPAFTAVVSLLHCTPLVALFPELACLWTRPSLCNPSKQASKLVGSPRGNSTSATQMVQFCSRSRFRRCRAHKPPPKHAFVASQHALHAAQGPATRGSKAASAAWAAPHALALAPACTPCCPGARNSGLKSCICCIGCAPRAFPGTNPSHRAFSAQHLGTQASRPALPPLPALPLSLSCGPYMDQIAAVAARTHARNESGRESSIRNAAAVAAARRQNWVWWRCGGGKRGAKGSGAGHAQCWVWGRLQGARQYLGVDTQGRRV